MTDKMLEILIGKHLDSEITPSEQRLLDAQLAENPDARQLLEQFHQLRELACATLTTQVNDKAQPAADIFERAWRQEKRIRIPARITFENLGRFAVGMAAGIVVGIGIFALMSERPADSMLQPPARIAVEDKNRTDTPMPAHVVIPTVPRRDVIRNVDFYNFTDDSGGQWLIEGLRENRVTPVAYYRDL